MGKMVEDARKVRNFSYEISHGDVMYSMMKRGNNSILYI